MATRSAVTSINLAVLATTHSRARTRQRTMCSMAATEPTHWRATKGTTDCTAATAATLSPLAPALTRVTATAETTCSEPTRAAVHWKVTCTTAAALTDGPTA